MAIDKEMLISFKDLEKLKRIPIGFPNTVVEQCRCYKKVRVVSTGTKNLEEEFKDIVSNELNPKPMNSKLLMLKPLPGRRRARTCTRSGYEYPTPLKKRQRRYSRI